jgi:hypothetical protein
MHIRKLTTLIITLGLANLLMMGPASAAAMRCGTRLVTDGDTQEEVVRNCGEPVQTNSRFITRASTYYNKRTSQTQLTNERGGYYFSEEILIEEWIFNFGRNKLMRKVTFENGIVVDVDTLKYGYAR